MRSYSDSMLFLFSQLCYTTIDGEIVERVEKYKYIVLSYFIYIILNSKLKFDINVLNIYKNVITKFIASKG